MRTTDFAEVRQRVFTAYAHGSYLEPVGLGTADDISYESSKATCAALEEAGVPVHVDVHEGLGHEYPPDLDQVIRDGLDWIKERSGRPASGTAS